MIAKEAVETGKEKLKESTFLLPSQGAYHRDMCGFMRSCKRTISLAKGTMYTHYTTVGSKAGVDLEICMVCVLGDKGNVVQHASFYFFQHDF